MRWLRAGTSSALEQLHRDNEFFVLGDITLFPVPFRVALKERIGGEVSLRDESLTVRCIVR